jgi:hypothetical protein
MAQGAVKKKPSKAAASAKPPPQKKGISKPQPPKKTSAAKMQKKFTSGLIAKTEKLLGERAGHLELIGKGKKADKGEKTKGGTRKFG